MWSRDEIDRYARHIVLPGVGAQGQARLKQSSVLVVGAGGLGVPILQYLVAAGVGRIGIVEMDTVDRSNLQRQVLYQTGEIGQPKATTAKARLEQLNPHIQIEVYPLQLNAENALQTLGPYDLILDASDNFPTRYLVNDACVLLDKPLVYGAIHQFEGQVSVFNQRTATDASSSNPAANISSGPCYRCLFPTPPAPGSVPSCSEAGVFGVLPGVVGSLMATEALKLILGLGQTLSGKLLIYDALYTEFRLIRFPKRPGCPLCGEHPSIARLQDYEVFCGLADG
jgi:adenylyltransferase/sulfurtransferase